MADALVRTSLMPSSQEWATIREQANILVKSGFLPEAIKTPEQAIAVVLKGRELGVPPMESLSQIAIIKGKPVCGAELLANLVLRKHGDNALIVTDSNNDHCTIEYKRPSWEKTRTFSFTMKDAQLAQLTGKDNWKKYPAAMLRARAISAVARMAFPDAISGMYTAEEMGADVNEEGELQLPAPEMVKKGNKLVDASTGEIVGATEATGPSMTAVDETSEGTLKSGDLVDAELVDTSTTPVEEEKEEANDDAKVLKMMQEEVKKHVKEMAKSKGVPETDVANDVKFEIGWTEPLAKAPMEVLDQALTWLKKESLVGAK